MGYTDQKNAAGHYAVFPVWVVTAVNGNNVRTVKDSGFPPVFLTSCRRQNRTIQCGSAKRALPLIWELIADSDATSRFLPVRDQTKVDSDATSSLGFYEYATKPTQIAMLPVGFYEYVTKPTQIAMLPVGFYEYVTKPTQIAMLPLA